MQPRRILAGLCCGHEFRLDLVKRKCCRIDDAGARRAIFDKRLRNQRAGIKTHRAGGDKIAPAHRNEIGGTRTGADEMNRHCCSPYSMVQPLSGEASSVVAMATVTLPTTRRGATSLVFHRRRQAPPLRSHLASRHDQGLSVKMSLFSKQPPRAVPAIRFQATATGFSPPPQDRLHRL